MSLTFLAVHAHPDDEASSTGGVFRLLANQGVRTVLVTCTNGEYGDAPGGVKPDSPEHGPDEVAALREVELARAVAVLGIDRLVRLGYRDSGMMGWPQNDDPRSFWSTCVDQAADRLAAVLAEERPQVIVTYNEIGFYGHPDHIQAHRITLAAMARLDYEPTLYYNAIPNSVMTQYRARWAEEERRRRDDALARGETPDVPEDPDGDELDLGTPDDEIAAVIDVASVVDAKFDALGAHESQLADSFWMTMGRDQFREAMRAEWFVRATNPTGQSDVVTDLFAGYR